MMAGRFLFRKLSSVTSRSASLLGAHAPASASAGAPATGPPAASAAARYLNTVPCSPPAAANTSRRTTGVFVTNNRMSRPACVNGVGGVKRSFSSAASNHQQHKRYYWEVPEDLSIEEYGKILDRNMTTTVWLAAFIAYSWLGMFDNRCSGGRKNRHQQRRAVHAMPIAQVAARA